MSVWMILTLVFLGVATVAYVLFGGADYGMGLVELFYPRKKQDIQALTKQAIGPVWEANHVWLIVVIVILFIGFPKLFAEMFTVLFVPLCLLLLGIVIRGAAFSFRHYDPVRDRTHEVHSLLFNLASVITPFLLGMMFASLLGVFPVDGTFWERYVMSWVTPFSVMTGLLFTCLCVLNALTFCHFEAASDEMTGWIRMLFRRIWWVTVAIAFLTAVLGVFSGELEKLLAHSAGVVWVVGGLSFLFLYVSVTRSMKAGSYLASGLVTTSLFLGAVLARFPVALETTSQVLTWVDNGAPAVSLVILNGALIAGLAIVLPFLGYLFVVFKK